MKMTHKLDVFTFGKFKGKSVRHVLEDEPTYILWLDSEGIVEFSQEILDNAQDEMFDGDDPSQGIDAVYGNYG